MNDYIEKVEGQAIFLIKWFLISVLTGLISGGIGVLFHFSLSAVTSYRTDHLYIVAALPFGGLVIAYIYSKLKKDSRGTNLVLDAIHSDENIPFHMVPAIFISTVITHLFGGSAGREGAALQIGGSIGHSLAQALRLDKNDKHIVIMCGMSAAFSAVFGTPIAASIFSIEVVSIGIMHYSALIPCSIASLCGFLLANHFGASPEAFAINLIPKVTVITLIKVLFLGAACALVSTLFCFVLHKAQHIYHEYVPNNYLAAALGGCLIILLSLILGTSDYLGAGMPVIKKAISGTVVPYAFLAKILFTAITLGAGYKGGEIVPSFFIGSTMGCLFGKLLGISPSLCAALGLIGVFCGVTNSPMTALLMSFELFNYTGVTYFLVIVAVSYGLSGYSSLYNSQRIVYSKHKSRLHKNSKAA